MGVLPHGLGAEPRGDDPHSRRGGDDLVGRDGAPQRAARMPKSPPPRDRLDQSAKQGGRRAAGESPEDGPGLQDPREDDQIYP